MIEAMSPDMMMPTKGSNLEPADDENKFLAVFYITIVVLSVVGNLAMFFKITNTILKLNMAILVVIQHFAACNLIYTILHILPAGLKLVTNQEISNNSLCNLQDIISWSYSPISGGLSCILLIIILLQLTSLMKTWPSASIHVHTLCSTAWLFSFCLSVLAGIEYSDSACRDRKLSRFDREFSTFEGIEKEELVEIVCYLVLVATMLFLSVFILVARIKGGRTVMPEQIRCLEGIPIIIFSFTLFFLPSEALKKITTDVEIQEKFQIYLRNINVLTIFVFCICVKVFDYALKANIRAIFKKVDNVVFNSLVRQGKAKQAEECITAEKREKDVDLWLDILIS